MYNRIESLCKENGINITRMCKEASITRALLTELKMGRTETLTAKTLSKIANYFNVSVESYLLCNIRKAIDNLHDLTYNISTIEKRKLL